MPWQTVLDIVGPPGTVDVVDTITLAPGNNASASVSGTPAERKLTLRIPRGEKGEQGAPGANSVPTDAAIAGTLNSTTSQTRAAADVLYSRRLDSVKYQAQDTNVLANGNFESGLLGWESTGTVTFDSVTEAWRGFNTVTMSGATSLASVPIPVEPDRIYRMETTYRGGTGGTVAGGQRLQYSLDGQAWSDISPVTSIAANANWTRESIERRIPAGTKYVRARVAFATGTPTIRVSEVSLEDVTEKRKLATVETTANAAASVTAMNVAIASNNTTRQARMGNTDNLINAGDFLPVNSVGDYWAASSPGIDTFISRTTSTGSPFPYCLRITGPGVRRVKNVNQISTTPGEIFYISAWVQTGAATPAGSVKLGIVERHPTSNAHQGARMFDVPIAAGWRRVEGRVTVNPANMAVGFVEFEVETTANFTGDLYVTGVELRSTVRAEEIPLASITGDRLAPTAVEERLPSRLQLRPNAVFIGDSNTADANHWPKAVCDLQGWTLRNFAVGGSAFIHATDSFLIQLQRARDSAAFTNASVGQVFISSPSNDIRAGHSIASAVGPVFDLAKSAFPNAQIHVLPALWPANPQAIAGYSTAHWTSLRTVVELLRVQAGRVGAGFMDESWTWLLGETTMMIAGEVHYNATGHAEIARRVNLYLAGGWVQSRTPWTKVTPMSAYYTVQPNSGWRAASVQRMGDSVILDGNIRASNSTSVGSDYAIVPIGFRPAYTTEITGRVAAGTAPVPITVYPSGEIRIGASVAGAHDLNVHGTWLID